MNKLKYTSDRKEKMIDENIKTLWTKSSPLGLKIVAINFLSQFTSNKDILSKIVYLHSIEKNRVIRNLMQKTIDGINLLKENKVENDFFDKLEASIDEEESFTRSDKVNHLTRNEVLHLRLRSINNNLL